MTVRSLGKQRRRKIPLKKHSIQQLIIRITSISLENLYRIRTKDEGSPAGYSCGYRPIRDYIVGISRSDSRDMRGGGYYGESSSSTRDFVCHPVAGAASGAIVATFVCLLDVIKTRLQVHGLPPGHKGSIIITSLRNVTEAEGLRGLYCELSPTIIALLPNWAVYFTVYERLEGIFHKNDDGSNQLSTGANMIAAAGAWIATSITTNPLWVVKTRLQTEGMRPGVVPYKSVLSALSRITHEEGLRDNTSVDKLSPGRVAIASSISKIVASIITYPHKVVRSWLQEQGQAKNLEARYSGVIDCARKVYQSEGFPGFYCGCATN